MFINQTADILVNGFLTSEAENVFAYLESTSSVAEAIAAKQEND